MNFGESSLLVLGLTIVEDGVEAEVVRLASPLDVLVNVSALSVRADLRLRDRVAWLEVLGDAIAFALVLNAIHGVEQSEVVWWVLISTDTDLVAAVGAR